MTSVDRHDAPFSEDDSEDRSQQERPGDGVCGEGFDPLATPLT